MNRQVLKPQNDVPLVVKLDKGPEGKETSSKISGETQYQYTVNDDQAVMWLPVAARTAMLRAHAQAGDEIEILKSSRGWTVQVLSDAQEEPEPAPPPRQIRVVAGQQRTSGATALAPHVFPMREIAQRLFEEAALIVKHGEDYCQQIGLPVQANFDDVRSLAISFLIERSKNGGRS